MKDFSYCDRIMGCDLSVSVITQSQKIADDCFIDIIDTATSYEKQFSRFCAKSELSLLNKSKNQTISPRFLSIFHIAQNLHNLTQGVFNPLLQAKAIGYTTSFDQMPAQTKSIKSPNYNKSIFEITLTDSQIKLQPTQELDFGGFLKGYLSMITAQEIMRKSDVAGVIVNIGGDLATRGTDENGTPFVINIYNPISNGEYPVTVDNSSISTSGTYKRTWENNDKTVSHIISAQKLCSETAGYISASVLHPDGAFADAFATALLADNTTSTQQILKNQKVPFLLIAQNGTMTKYLI